MEKIITLTFLVHFSKYWYFPFGFEDQLPTRHNYELNSLVGFHQSQSPLGSAELNVHKVILHLRCVFPYI